MRERSRSVVGLILASGLGWGATGCHGALVLDGALFWSDMEIVGTTIFPGGLVWGPLDSLDGTYRGTAILLPGDCRGLRIAGGSVYAVSEDPMYASTMVRLSGTREPQPIGTLPGEAWPRAVVVLGDWVLVSAELVATCPQPTLDLDAIPIGGGQSRPVVTGLHAAAVGLGPGIVFVDASNRLVAMSASDVAAALTPAAAP